MSINIIHNEFIYNNKCYRFVAHLFSKHSKNPKLEKIILDTKCITVFEFTNSINQLCLDGSLFYVDKSGIITQYLSESFPFMQVLIEQYSFDNDGNIQITTDNINLQLDFIVNKIEIVKRKNDKILYKFHLVSTNWYNCNSLIEYTTYDKTDPNDKNILKILQDCFSKTNQQLYTNELQSNIQLDYITNGNDNLFSITKFLFNKFYTCADNSDEILKFLVYNIFIRKYDLLDVSTSRKNIKTISNITLSFLAQQTEDYMYKTNNQLNSILNMSKIDAFNLFQKRTIKSYDYNQNTINEKILSADTIVNYYNGGIDETMQSQPKQQLVSPFLETNTDFSELNFNQNVSFWNNTFNVYGKTLEFLIGDNSIAVKTDGNIERLPGDMVNIVLDKPSNELMEDKQYMDKYNALYSQLDGTWTIGKVTMLMSPSESYFKQSLSLFRNFIFK